MTPERTFRGGTMDELIKSALSGVFAGVGAIVTWYAGSFIGNPIKELQVLRSKVIEQLILLDRIVQMRSNNTPELQDVIKQLRVICAQTRAAFLSISRGFKGPYVRRLGFNPTEGAESLLRLSELLNKIRNSKPTRRRKKQNYQGIQNTSRL
jgi:hypothetical protein